METLLEKKSGVHSGCIFLFSLLNIEDPYVVGHHLID